MKLFLAIVTTAAVLSFSNAQSNEARTLQARQGGRLQKLKEKKCRGFLETFTCPASSSGCDNLERPVRPADEGELVFDDEMMSEFQEKREEFKEKLLECVCCDVVSIEDILAAKGDRPSGMLGGGGGGFGGGRPGKGDMDIQAVLDEKCTDFLNQGGCANVEERVEEEITCERFDSLAAGNTRGGRGGRKGVMLYCGCGCRD